MSESQLNRREVLAATSVAAVSGFCFTRRIEAADDVQTLKFIVVSDTHLGRKDNDYSERQWRRAIAEINEFPGEFVLHLGDVVDSGRKEQYPIYGETRKLLKKPIHEIPGNHDPVDLFRRHVVKDIDRSVDYGGVRFVLFNNAHRDSHLGFITTEQIQWLGRQCAEAKKKGLKIVIGCHVPIHSNKSPDRGWYVKPKDGQTAFYELQQQYAGSMLACFHGHFHNGIRGWRDHQQTVESLFPSVCYNQKRGLKERIAEGKATGFFVDELRPGYVLAELGQGELKLRYKPIGQDLNGEYAAQW